MPDQAPTVPAGCDSRTAASACQAVPGAGARIITARPELARAVCATCAVAGPCLDAALAEERYLAPHSAPTGVRGGLTGAERGSLLAGREAGVDAFLRFARRRAAAAAAAS